MPKIVVTGGAGFIGSHLVDALVAKGHQVSVIDDLSSGKKKYVHRQARLHKLDIRSSLIEALFRRLKPQYVFHLAAQKNLRLSLLKPEFDADVNVAGSITVVRAAERAGAKQIIFSSTGGAIYGHQSQLPVSEQAEERPLSPYGLHKLMTEHYFSHWSGAKKIQATNLRYANVYGPRQDPNGEAGVVSIFVDKLFHGRPIEINGHGRQTRDFVFVHDVVAANLAAMNNHVTQPINISTGRETSVVKLAHILMRLTGRRQPIRYQAPIQGEVERSSLDWRRAKKTLGWQPTVDLEEGLQWYIDWYQRRR